jgi:hypothetical protein
MHTPLAGTALHRDSHLRRRDSSPLSVTINRTRRRRISLPLCDGESLHHPAKLREARCAMRDARTDGDARAARVHALHRLLPDVLDSR